MHVLITRPEVDGAALKSRVEQLGCRATLAPLIRIVPNAIAATALDGATALVATSRNALKAFEGSPALAVARTLPLYVVGPGTAEVARKLQFQNIIEGGGIAADLVPVLAADQRTRGGPLVLLAGDVAAFDLEGALTEKGIDVVPVLAYQAVVAKTLPADVIELLHKHDLDAVALMSPRTAETWARLAGGLLAPSDLSTLTYLCLSEAVAAALKARLNGAQILIAARPNLEEMLALVKRLAAHSGRS